MRRRQLAFCLILTFAYAHTPTRAYAQTRGYYRQPSIHGNDIVFVSEGDLWKVDARGGVANRLTTNLAEETNPQISPDGQQIAFTGRYDGVADIYTIPTTGGTPVRHSWDAGAQAVGWTNDGRIIYTTARYSGLPNAQLLTVDPSNNSRRLIPLAQAYDGAFDGSTLFFTRLRPQGSNTKRYKGGTAQNIWKAQISQNNRDFTEAVPLTSDYTGTSRGVHVWNGRVFFVSDRDNIMNIWSMDENGKNLVQHTFHKDYDVRDFSIDNGRIVYQQGADLWLVDLRITTSVMAKASEGAPAGTPTKLPITIASDFEQLRGRWVKKPMDFLTDMHIDKTGDRVALIARGVVFVAPVGQGRFLQLPNNGGVRYRDMRFSPDGKSLYTLNDRSGEVELWRTPANGVGEGVQLTNDAKILRWDLEVSPDGKYIANDDKNQRLYVYDVATKNNKLIGESKYGGFGYWWSPDSKTLAVRENIANGNSVIELYDVATGVTTPVTSDRYDSNDPVFSPDGAWLYFLSDRTFNSTVGSPWGARQPEPYFNNQTKIYAIRLKDGVKFPFAPKTELDADSAAPAVAHSYTRTLVNSSLYEVPIPAGNYRGLSTDGKRLYFLSREDRYSAGATTKLMTLEFKNEDIKPEIFAEEVRSFDLSGDAKKVMFRKADDIYVVPAAAKAPGKDDLGKNKLDLSGWMLQLERKEELRSLFVDAWRLERDFFYDPGMHGLDWPAMRTKYMPLAERVSDRSELSDVIAQMVGELSALHIFVYGGDLRGGQDTIPQGSLGAVLEPVKGTGTGGKSGWRIAHIYVNDPDVPGDLSPLSQAGVNVTEGDIITSINGVPLSTVNHPAELLVGRAGKQTLLELATGKRAIVYPITPARDFYPSFNKDALIIDVRNNNGGNIDSWLLGKLMRKPWMYWQDRVGEPTWNMQYAFRGPMATIVNEWSSSDGEAFPEGFRRLGLGKIVGTRTWGGEIWLSSSNVLADRGIATAAESGVYGPEGKWLIEGHGVDPDVVVDNLPVGTFDGSDAQLEATVKLLLEEVARKPNPMPRPPAYPKKTGN